MFTAMSPFMPEPPPGAGSPMRWGDEDYVEAMLGGAFDLSIVELDIPSGG